jgi:hypothetical protein
MDKLRWMRAPWGTFLKSSAVGKVLQKLHPKRRTFRTVAEPYNYAGCTCEDGAHQLYLVAPFGHVVLVDT